MDEKEDTEQVKEENTEENEEIIPTKRVIRRKSKKEKEHPLSAAIRLAVESGKVDFGLKKGLMNTIKGKAKLFVIASNMPVDARKEVIKNSKETNTPIIEYEGNNMDLGSVCGKPFSVSILSIYEVGNSNILDIAKKK